MCDLVGLVDESVKHQDAPFSSFGECQPTGAKSFKLVLGLVSESYRDCQLKRRSRPAEREREWKLKNGPKRIKYSMSGLSHLFSQISC